MASNSPGLNTTVESPDVSKAPRIFFLLFFIVCSFVGNVFILIVLLHNVKLRKTQNLLIANLCAVCIIDCTCNMSFVLGSLLVSDWLYGTFMCKVSNFSMNLVTIQTMLMLTALSADRYFTLRYSNKYEAWRSTCRVWSVIAYFWLHSFIFSIPFLTKAVASTFRPELHVCTFTSETSLAFIYSTLFLCFLGPLIIIVVFHVITSRLTCLLKYSRRLEVTQTSYAQMFNDKTHAFQTSYMSCTYTATLFLLWLLFEVPFIITFYIKQYEHSKQLESGVFIYYPWEVDATFLWLRFFYSCLFPGITFSFQKEIWKSAKECVLCRRHNSVVDMEVEAVSSVAAIKKENPQKEQSPKVKDKDKIEAPSHSLAFNVPVLFATSTGICIEDSPVGSTLDANILTTSAAETHTPKGKTLDITYPEYEYGDELMGDTSDYDSSCEVDQYSISQPVSTRNVHGAAVHRSRSMSDPEIKYSHSCHKKNKITDNGKDFSGTSGADSGLDLSGTASSSLKGALELHLHVTRVHDNPNNTNPDSLSMKITPDSEKDSLSRAKSYTDHLSYIESSRAEHETTEKQVSIKTEVSKLPLPPRLNPISHKGSAYSPVKTKRKIHRKKRLDNCPSSNSSLMSDQLAHVGVSGRGEPSVLITEPALSPPREDTETDSKEQM